MIITSEPVPVLRAHLRELLTLLDLMSPADFAVLRPDLGKLLRTVMTLA
tara:strand:- start:6009 stop:6155 length:147 start_codon:yes stop_codon:yes gene_type:complete